MQWKDGESGEARLAIVSNHYHSREQQLLQSLAVAQQSSIVLCSPKGAPTCILERASRFDHRIRRIETAGHQPPDRAKERSRRQIKV